MSELHSILASFNTGLAITNGLSGGSVDRINIKGGRWKLQSADGSIINVDTLYLDVVMLVGNPNVSKQLYLGPYSGDEGVAPDCYSHNGVGPSVGVNNPQCKTCADCEYNRWGTSRRNDGTDGKGKRCQDRKMLAVAPIAYLGANGMPKPYELNVPPASLPNLYAYVMDIMRVAHQSGRPMEAFDYVTRLGFDPNKDGQVITFTRMGQMNDQSLNTVKDLLLSKQCEPLIRLNDKPAGAALAAPKASPALSGPAPRAAAPIAAPAAVTSDVSARDRIAAAKAAQTAAVAPQTAESAPQFGAQGGAQFAAGAAVPADLDSLIAGAGFGVVA